MLILVGCTNFLNGKNDAEGTRLENVGIGSSSNSEFETGSSENEVVNGTPLTNQEIAWFNKSFFNNPELEIVNYFLASEYLDIRDISFTQLFYDLPEIPESEMTNEEVQSVREYEAINGGGHIGDLYKVPVVYMEDVLKKYTNLTLDETNKVGLEKWLYLSEYEAYYSTKSDIGYMEIEVTSGYKGEDGCIHLIYCNGIGLTYEVVLQPHAEGYYFVSNIMIPKKLDAEQIRWFNENFFNVKGKEIVNYFLNSEYSDVKEINLYSLFYNCPNEFASEKEKELFVEKSGEELYTDLHKVPMSYMENVIDTYTRISLEQIPKDAFDMFVYLADSEAYFSQSGDYKYHECKIVSGEKKIGDYILQYICGENKGEVVLRKDPNGYYFVSNRYID